MLPDDFNEALATAQELGILNEDPETLDTRITGAIQTAGVVSGQVELSSFGDWLVRTKKTLLAALHNQLCDQEKGCLKEDYKDLLNLGLTPEGVTAVSAAISGVISAINPAFAVSNVLLFLAIWLLKRGLNQWCSLPV